MDGNLLACLLAEAEEAVIGRHADAADPFAVSMVSATTSSTESKSSSNPIAMSAQSGSEAVSAIAVSSELPTMLQSDHRQLWFIALGLKARCELLYQLLVTPGILLSIC